MFKQKWSSKKAKIVLIIIIITLTIIDSAVFLVLQKQAEAPTPSVAGAKIEPREVQVQILNIGQTNNLTITTSGIVKADKQIDIVALNSGTIRSLTITVGDAVTADMKVTQLHNSNALTTLANAQLQVSNTEQNLAVTRRLTDETIRQAGLGVTQANESITSAKIALKTAEDNVANALDLQQRQKSDSLRNAVIAYDGYLNTIDGALDQINFIINEDNGPQLAGIAPTLGVTNAQSLINAEQSFRTARDSFSKLAFFTVTDNTIITMIERLTATLALTRLAIKDTVIVLNNTIANANFSDAALNAEQNNFSALQSTIITTNSAIQTSLQNLNNIDSIHKQEIDRLRNAVNAARSQVSLAKTALRNAQAAILSVQESQQKQLLSVRGALDSAKGQFNLARNQVADLTISSPLAGQIIATFVEVGDEVKVGQKIATVARADIVKVIIEITAQDISKIAIGQTAVINDDIIGTIARIDPTADPVSKKIKVEIAATNSERRLIPETFVDVAIKTNREGQSSPVTTFLIPLKAVTITQTESYIFLFSGGASAGNLAIQGKAVKTLVELGQAQGEGIEVISGLQDGDVLIVEGNRGLAGDEIVEIKS